MRLPNAAHEAHPWVIAQIAPDFALLDVWALPVRGGARDFETLLDVIEALDPTNSRSALTRALFRLRFLLGAWLGWDDRTRERAIPGCTETSLRARLPEPLRGTARAILRAPRRGSGGGGFVPLYRTEREWAAELSNDTVHGVLHLAWIDEGDGRHRAQMGVYVKPRGALGEVYMKLIQPFRHWIVYPALMRQIGSAWGRRGARDGTA